LKEIKLNKLQSYPIWFDTFEVVMLLLDL